MTCAALPAWGMDNLSVISYSDATSEQKQAVFKIVESDDSLKIYRHTLNHPNTDFKKDILLSGDTAKGAALYTDSQIDDKKVRTINALVIDAASRWQGYGRHLMQKTQEDAHQLGIERILLQARSNAIQFYTAIGFKPDFDSDLPYLPMYKDLKPSKSV